MRCLYNGFGVTTWRLIKDRNPGKVLRDPLKEQDVRQNRA